MGLWWVSLGLLVLLHCYCTFCNTQLGLWSINPPGNPGLYCGAQGLWYVMPAHTSKNAAVKVSVLDRNGQWLVVSNNSTCGMWLSVTPAGSLTIHAAYDGCFVYEKNYDFAMTISIEQAYPVGIRRPRQTVELICPDLEAFDIPSHDQCSTVHKENRISCASSPVSQATCESQGCCFDPSRSAISCFYGNTVTVQCTSDGQISLAISTDLTLPPLIVDSIRLVGRTDAMCSPVQKNDHFVLFQFPVSSCGTTSRGNGSNILYENNLVADKDVRTWRAVSITRDSTLRLHIQCSYVSSGMIPLNVGVLTLPPPLPVASSGPLTLELRIAKDNQYQNYYADKEYPVVKLLRDAIPIEVRILQRNDPNVFLVLHECWATPTADHTNPLQWPVLVDGCPYTGDNYQTVQLSDASYKGLDFPMYYKRFIVNTFTFVDASMKAPLNGLVYFHCSASVCFPTLLDSCKTLCQQKKKRSASNLTDSLSELVSSNGPVILQNSPELYTTKDSEGYHVFTNPLEKEWFRMAVVGCALAVLIMIIGLLRYLKHKCQAQTVKV